ncbi:MAG: carboxy terminal-processing peptidase [Ekhidna sp.]|nr:carboxy terminal-processing peptidase [Ekhidna sp.]
MNKLLLVSGFLMLTSFGLSSEYGDEFQSFFKGDTLKALAPTEEHPSEAYVITNLLKRLHYKKLELSDSISSVVFDNYFQSLDPNKADFYQSDIRRFQDLRFELDDQIPKGDLDFAYEVFATYRERVLERIDYIFELLDNEFDFTKDEKYVFDREDAAWPSNEPEKKEIWRKIIKNQALSYKLAGKEWADLSKNLKRRYQRIQKAVYQYNSGDVFQIYMNAYTNAYDPHTDYFSPPAAANFQIEMGLSLEGIGARLMQNLDYTEVAEIIPGGPAYKSKAIQKDDKIIGVAQGDDGEFLDIIGWRLDDVVAKIRGPKGSVVRLQILKASEGINALPETLRLVRDKIKLEDQAASAEMIPISEGNTTYNLGVITIPTFYLNFEDLRAGLEDYRSTTRDVRKLVSDLKNQGMDGLLIDLRYNGGGALQEAIELTGLFIEDGPVVQVRNYDETVDLLKDEDGGEVYYGGPLAVLVNKGSASASEIFSGAIQDYKRGVVIGEGTFGKGTVQNIINLERYIKNPDFNLGQLKMTLAKFYRVSGSSNQKVGIAPDIQFPSLYSADGFGEAGRENALPWDEIDGVSFLPSNMVSEELLDHLNRLYREDLNSDPDLQKLVGDIEKAKKNREINSVSLNLEVRKADQDDNQSENELYASLNEGEVATEDENSQRLKKDPYLKEGLRLLAVMKNFKID